MGRNRAERSEKAEAEMKHGAEGLARWNAATALSVCMFLAGTHSSAFCP